MVVASPRTGVAAVTTDRRPAPRRPGPGGVLWGSLALFAVLFALLTYQLSLGAPAGGSTASSGPVAVRKVIKKRVITTVIPTPGKNRVVSSPATSSTAEVAPEPVTTSAS